MKRLKITVGSLVDGVTCANIQNMAIAPDMAGTTTNFRLLSCLKFGSEEYNTLQSIGRVADQTKKLGS